MVGLDYPAVFSVARILDITVDKRLLAKLRALESMELERLNSTKDQEDDHGR